jgi:flagellar basal body-associated protein FliL
MADEKDVKKENDSGQEKTDEKSAGKRTGGRFLQLIVIGVIVAFCGGAGFGVGRLLGGLRKAEPAQTSKEQQAIPEEPGADAPPGNSQNVWYYSLHPVVANLDEPGVKRYVRAALTLAVNHQLDPKKGVAFFDEKKPLLTNWLTIYLASLGIDETRGDKNLKRIQSQILDTFNAKLFPDAKPQIEGILFREFAVQ